MAKLDISSFHVQIGHSLEEYFYKYGSLYNKCKLTYFYIDELEYMDKNRTYWAIKYKDGKTRFYELPKHHRLIPPIAPIYRKPLHVAMLILISTTLLSFTSLVVGKTFFGKKDFDDIPEVIPEDVDKLLNYYKLWKAKYPEGDASKQFNACQLANIAMGKLTNQTSHYFTVGHGKSDTNILFGHVIIDISNAFICDENNAMEESISYGNQRIAPKVSKRDYLTDGVIKAYDGQATSSSTSIWNENPTETFASKEDYMKAAGKDPHSPFLYLITKDTVLTDKVYDIDPDTQEKNYGNSNAIRNADGTYKISLDLHNEYSVTRYVKRMRYLSGKTPDFFRKIHMEFNTDSDLNLIESRVDETYSIIFMQTTGYFNTKYYTSDVPSIPKPTENFDYSKYPF